MESRQQDQPLLISLRSEYEEIGPDQDEIQEQPSLQEIKECLRILDGGGCFWTQKTTCGIITLFIVVATCLAFADAIRRAVSCSENDSLCANHKVSELILAVTGSVVSTVAIVTTCNIPSSQPTLDLLSAEKYNKIYALGKKFGLQIEKENTFYHVASTFRRHQRIYMNTLSAQAQRSTGFFAAAKDKDEKLEDKLEIVVVAPNVKTSV